MNKITTPDTVKLDEILEAQELQILESKEDKEDIKERVPSFSLTVKNDLDITESEKNLNSSFMSSSSIKESVKDN